MISADTNIFAYLYQSDEPAKTSAARELVAALTKAHAAIGLQVVGELQNVVRRKFRRPLVEAADAGRMILNTFSVFLPTQLAAAEALTQMAAGRLNYWDALLVFSASHSGVKVMFSEDMHDGALVSGVRILNPFQVSGGLSQSARDLLEL